MREKASQHVRDARYKLYADGRMFDTEEDLYEETDLLALRLWSKEWQSAYDRLKPFLDKHVAVTKAADPVQEAKRKKKAKSTAA